MPNDRSYPVTAETQGHPPTLLPSGPESPILLLEMPAVTGQDCTAPAPLCFFKHIIWALSCSRASRNQTGLTQRPISLGLRAPTPFAHMHPAGCSYACSRCMGGRGFGDSPSCCLVVFSVPWIIVVVEHIKGVGGKLPLPQPLSWQTGSHPLLYSSVHLLNVQKTPQASCP